MNPRLSVVIPAYNEEKRIEKTLRAVREYLAGQPYAGEVIVVDDGSKDATGEIVRAFGATFPEMRVVAYGGNCGKGYAVRAGMRAAKGEWRLFMDADNATSIEQLDRLLAFAGAYEVVISSRHLPESRIIASASGVRSVLSHLFILATRLLVPLGVSDTQNGFKLFSARAAETVFDAELTNGWAFDIEALARARAAGFSIKEVPVDWVNGGHSRMTFGGAWRMGADLLRLAWKYRQAR